MFDSHFFKETTISLASNIDRAWETYINQKINMQEREIALVFLCFAFDLPMPHNRPQGLTRRLLILMADRMKHRTDNLEYIPGKSPCHLGLSAQEQDLGDNTEAVKKAYRLKHLLTMSAHGKHVDRLRHSVMFNEAQRAKYRLVIYNGFIYQQGKVYDSSKKISHTKKGFVAYTLNANGELSVFEHFGGRENSDGKILFHSSMNEGKDVVAAGELEIKGGRLLSITTHSGHYNPSLFTVYRMLEHLSSRGVDISKTIIWSDDPAPALIGARSTRTYVSLEYGDIYKTPAIDFYKGVKQHVLRENIKLVDSYIKGNDSTSFFNIFCERDLLRERGELAKEFNKTLNDIFSNDRLGIASLKRLESTLSETITRNNFLSIASGKRAGSGRFGKKLGLFKRNINRLYAEKGTHASLSDAEQRALIYSH